MYARKSLNRNLFIGVAFSLISVTAAANTFGSVEPAANPAVVDTEPLRQRSLDIREAFAERLFQCGVVDRVINVLTLSGAISTINSLNTSFEVVAGGFQGETNPAYAYTVIDSGPNAASGADISVMTDALGFVFSQFSAFLLDADNPDSFDFPANYAVLRFTAVPPLAESAALFETVGEIDSELFSTDSSGYTQFGLAYLSLQSFVEDQQFIDGYVEAAKAFGVEYTPIIDGAPSLFSGGAGFPGNDWTASPNGEDYLARIPDQSHRALRKVRRGVVRFTKRAVKRASRIKNDYALNRALSYQHCR